MAKILYVKDKEGVTFFPVTSEKGVLDDSGVSLTTKLEALNLATTRSKGYYTSAANLSAAIPSPVVGDWAIVDVEGTATIYSCQTAGTWASTGEAWSGGEIDLSDYYTKVEVNGIVYTAKDVTSELLICFSGQRVNSSGAWNGQSDTDIYTLPVVAGQRYLISCDPVNHANYAYFTVHTGINTNVASDVGVGTQNVGLTNLYYTIPEGGTQMFVTVLKENSGVSIRRLIEPDMARVEALEEEVCLIKGEKTIVLDVNSMQAGRTLPIATGVPATNRALVNSRIYNIDVSNYQGGTLSFIKCQTGNNNNGHVFLDKNGTVLSSWGNGDNKRLEVQIPETAEVFKSQCVVSMFDGTIEDTNVYLKRSTSADTMLNYRDEIERRNNEYMLPLGEKDNLLSDLLDGAAPCIMFNFISSSQLMNGKMYVERDANGKITELAVQGNYQGEGNSSATTYTDLTAVLYLKKTGNSDHCWKLMHGSGAGYYVQEGTAYKGQEIRQSNQTATAVMGTIVDMTEDTIVLYHKYIGATNDSLRLYGYTDKTLATAEGFELNRDYSCAFREALAVEDIELWRRYYSRSEKLGSRVRGKIAIVFGDSLSAFNDALVQDWGMQLWTFSSGGNHMGYTGSLSNWLCRPEAITKFNEWKPDHVDYIINCTGANGTMGYVPTAEQINFCYNNKRWFGDDSETDPWDSLSSDVQQSGFTPEICYVTAFYALHKIYPTAQAVVCATYRTPSSAYIKITDGKWTSVEDFSAAYANGNMVSKNEILHEIADALGAVWVDNNVRVGILNAPQYITDGVHPNFIGSTDWARCIAEALGFAEVVTVK